MKWYRVNLELSSGTASAWQADTIFGHLCWGMRYLYGEAELGRFLDAYRDGSPPVLISNGFPGDLLPRPLLPTPDIPDNIELDEQRKQFREQKKARQTGYLTPEEFQKATNGEMLLPSPKPPLERQVTLKNQISRISGTTGGEGQLYTFEADYQPAVSIYLKIGDDYIPVVEKLFTEYIARSGYGKRKTVGYGQVAGITFEPFTGFSSPESANGFVSLSNFVPVAGDPVNGSWQILVKYGKLGEDYAIQGEPFKKPLLMLQAGAAFYDSPCREYYGGLVSNLSDSYPKVEQYAFALPVSMILPQRMN